MPRKFSMPEQKPHLLHHFRGHYSVRIFEPLGFEQLCRAFQTGDAPAQFFANGEQAGEFSAGVTNCLPG